MKGAFYQQVRATILGKLSQSWIEDAPCIYDFVCQIQDELVPELVAEHPDFFHQEDGENITLTFQTVAEMEASFREAQAAFKRGFESEEHECPVCMRSLLGEKFSFLTSCEHFVCTDCLKDLILAKIESTDSGFLQCPSAGCGKALSDLDVRNVGLDASQQERYE